MVEFPPGEPQEVCAICGEGFEESNLKIASNYANAVCMSCDDQAVHRREISIASVDNLPEEVSILERGEDTAVVEHPNPDSGNPVFIDGQKCWRRYRFGGWVSRRDEHDCDSVEEFYEKHRADS